MWRAIGGTLRETFGLKRLSQNYRRDIFHSVSMNSETCRDEKSRWGASSTEDFMYHAARLAVGQILFPAVMQERQFFVIETEDM